MTAARPREALERPADQALYTVNQLATELGVTPRAIRFYESAGLIAPRRAGTTRVFDRRDRARLLLVLRGKRLGFSLGEIRAFLDLYDSDRSQISQMQRLLELTRHRVAELERQRRDLDQTLLELRDIGKNFGPVQALSDINLTIPPGQVTALVGDNGAGKSTLIKTVSGIWQPDEGQIFWQGSPVHLHSPKAAADLGIATVYQDLALCDNLDIVQNMFLGREELKHWQLDEIGMELAAKQTLADLSVVTVRSIRQPVGSLSGGHQLVWLTDIDRMIAAEPPQWDVLIRRARRYRVDLVAALQLERSRSVLGAAVPAGVVSALAGGRSWWRWWSRQEHRVGMARWGGEDRTGRTYVAATSSGTGASLLQLGRAVALDVMAPSVARRSPSRDAHEAPPLYRAVGGEERRAEYFDRVAADGWG